MVFYLGTHEPSWLTRTARPLCISRRRLARYRTWPRALGPWMLDSGGFTELSLSGRWQTSPQAYAADARRALLEIGGLCAAAPQDWMCEPLMLARTALSVPEHQRRTIDSYRQLQDLAPEVPWFPVLQGWDPADYLHHVDAYAAAGVDLSTLPLVGVGTVCRRQHTAALSAVIEPLAALGLPLHGFGIKLQGLESAGTLLASADSLAWSYHARRNPPLPGCRHASCSNCFRFATTWADRIQTHATRPRPQLCLPFS